jgi:hypothetical protein
MEEPMIKVVRGNPTPEELAALVAVLRSHGTSREPAATAGRTTIWTDRARGPMLRHFVPRPGPLAWRGSALPR